MCVEQMEGINEKGKGVITQRKYECYWNEVENKMILKRRKEVDVVQMSEGWKEHDTKKERDGERENKK